MAQPVDGTKSCDPQLLDITKAPSHKWSLDQLTAAAREEHAAILAAEQSITSRYWRLGQVLHLARKQFAHGQWDRYLKELGIEKTRSVKAMRIFEAFTTAEQTDRLTVAEAYAKRKRRPRAVKVERVSATNAQEPRVLRPAAARTWSQFAAVIITEVERQLDEAEFLAAAELHSALEEVARATGVLRRLEERLQRRNNELNDAVPAEPIS